LSSLSRPFVSRPFVSKRKRQGDTHHRPAASIQINPRFSAAGLSAPGNGSAALTHHRASQRIAAAINNHKISVNRDILNNARFFLIRQIQTKKF
jgi:hypothetical protein